jgi:hypothetical protein
MQRPALRAAADAGRPAALASPLTDRRHNPDARHSEEETIMILVRDVFQLKFGKAREAVSLWTEGLALAKKIGYGARSARMLTDLVGPYYTLVIETSFDSLSEYERAAQTVMGNDDWQAWYTKVVPLAEGGHREIFTIVE